ncbi:hypothetical protein LINPERPRIM_LOCUS14337, partial [Linum perenne]
CSSLIVAEAKVLLEALSIAATSRDPTIVKSDCINLVVMLGLRDLGNVSAWLLSLRQILDTCSWITVSFVSRRTNLAADRVAKAVRNGSLPLERTSCSFL